MLLTESHDKERLLLDALRESFRETRGRDGDPRIHLSDLLTPRKAYWGRTTDTLPSDKEALYWAAGRAHEDVIARLGGMVVGSPPAVSAVSVPGLVVGEYREKDGIAYRPDFRWDNLPAEMKTIRHPLPTLETLEPGEVPDGWNGYLEQLLGYCCLDEASAGYLIVFDLLTPALGVYHIEYSSSEIRNWGQELATRLAWLKYSLAGRFPKQLPLCPEWMCGTRVKKALTPAYCQGCQTDLTTKQAKSHQKSKRKYRSHIVTPPLYVWEYTPRCKFYGECKPWENDEIRR